MMIHTPLMNVMVSAVLKAGKGLQRSFGEVSRLTVETKSPGDFVTSADKRSEETLYDVLEKARPGYCFQMEEGGWIEGTDKTHCWHVDPLDGTFNFLRSIPYFAISLALEREGQLCAGVVYNPITDNLLVAEKGRGAFNNNHRMRVSQIQDRPGSAAAIGFPRFLSPEAYACFMTEKFAPILTQIGRVRTFGSAALDLSAVANGQIEAYWDQNLKPWDMAAGIVLIREAGGFVSDVDGGDDMLKTSTIIAGNPFFHSRLLTLLKPSQDAGFFEKSSQ